MRYRSAGAGHPLKDGDGRRIDGSRAADWRRSPRGAAGSCDGCPQTAREPCDGCPQPMWGRAKNARRTSRGIGRRAAQRRKRHVRGACRSRAPDRGTRVHGSTVRSARKDSAGVRRFPPPARRGARIRGRSAISIGIRGRLIEGRAVSAHQRSGTGRAEAPSTGAPPAGENRPLALYS